MKFAAIIFAIVATAQMASASAYNPAKIYKALQVEEVALNPGILGVSRTGKSVGGLSCVREVVVYPGAKPTFTCAIDNSEENFRAIYEALQIKPVYLNPGFLGISRLQKAVGGLTCIRSLVVSPKAKPSFECEISEI